MRKSRGMIEDDMCHYLDECHPSPRMTVYSSRHKNVFFIDDRDDGKQEEGRKDVQSSELLYLDLSKSFDNSTLSWELIRNGDLPIYTYSSTAIVSLDNSIIFLIGGYMVNNNTIDYDFSHQVYAYDYHTSKWTTPSITGNIPIRQQMTGVIDNKGIIYIFGGFNITNFTTLTGKVYNEMNTLDTSSMAWKNLTITNNLPPLSSDYSANILPNGIIVYIGGQDGTGTLVKMNNIKLFDTNKVEWSYMPVNGDNVDSRWFFSSVLTPDGYIIIFGGCTLTLSSVSPKLAVLDTNIYEWSVPSGSNANSPPSIYGHTANLYNNYMIITFGYDIDDQMYNSQVYLYDITNNTWVTRFNPPPPSTHSKKFLKPLLIGLGTGIGVVVLICIAIFVYRKIMENRVLEIP
ncbi:hypothetical protein Glove_421g133 [Diversispora epigaea]|uniref:Galactose oxidase n=1 Tax=Diversispora epigaea TaxID=1348612 RepID=A0A397GVS0_9GLOM|nr:hypothetical protein Glove_421g133 [Diversispora epigaea]